MAGQFSTTLKSETGRISGEYHANNEEQIAVDVFVDMASRARSVGNLHTWGMWRIGFWAAHSIVSICGRYDGFVCVRRRIDTDDHLLQAFWRR